MFRPKVGDLSPDSRHYWDGDVWQWRPLWLVPQEAIDSVRHCFRRPATAAHLLATGLLNQSWRVETHDGTYVLRVSRSERSAEQLAYEHTFILALKEHLRIVVPPLAGRGGKTLQSWQRRLLSLFPFVEGTDGTAVHPEDRMRAAATVLAEIRRASLTLSPIGQRPGFRSVDEHPRWIWLVLKPILSRDLAGAYGFDDLFAVFDREIERLDVWLDHLRVSGRLQPRATVHGEEIGRASCRERV